MKHSFKNSLMVILTLMSLIISTVGVTPAHAAANWEVVGEAGFSDGQAYYTSLALDLDNHTPYVAYRDGANDDKATVMKFDGMDWVVVGEAGFSAGQADYISLALDNDTDPPTPYVAYRDGDNSDKATVMKFNGTSLSWEAVGPAGFSAGRADYTSLALYNHTPYVAYRDWGNSDKATVMKFNGTSLSWEAVGPAVSAGQADYTSLALDSSGMPYVAYRAWGTNRATVKKFNGTSLSWEAVGPAVSAAQADYISLALDNDDGTPYVAYRDWSTPSNQATVKKFNGTSLSWEVVGTAGFSAGSADYISLALDNDTDTPYVAYKDLGTQSKATVMTLNGMNWEVVVIAGVSAGSADYTSLAVVNNTPYVAYRDGALGNGNKATVMKYTGDALPHTVTFHANGGTGSMTPQIANSPATLTLNTFTRVGYAFAGWNTAANGSGTPYGDGVQYNFIRDITLYARWTPLPGYIVTFNANGGSGSMSQQFANIPTALTLNAFTHPGYAFTGWNTIPDGSGTAYDDEAEYGFSANITLYAQWTSNALDFDGLDDYVSIASMPELNDFTLEYWLYPRSPDGSLDFITYTQSDIFHTAKDGSGNIWILAPGLDWVQVTNATPDEWTHLAFVRSGETLTVYKDGEWVDTWDVDTTALSSDWCFGGECDGDEFGNMRLDEVRIWDFARSEQEIHDNMDIEVLSPQDDLVAYYKFNQGAANEDNTGVTTAIDSSGSGLNGTLNHFALNGETSNWVNGTVRGADTTAPNAPQVIEPEEYTNDDTPTISGTAEAGSSVNVWYLDGEDDQPLCEDVLVDEGGAWSCVSIVTLDEGTYELKVNATDASNNTSPDTLHSFTVDLTAPASPIVSNPVGVINNNTPTIDGTAEPYTYVEVWYLHGPTYELLCEDDLADELVAWSCESSVALDDGPNKLSVVATDKAGNFSDPKFRNFTVDTIAPDTQITSQPANPSNTPNATFTFSSPGSTFECKLDSGTFAACTSPKDYTGLADGSHTFEVRAKDAAQHIDPTPASYTWMLNSRISRMGDFNGDGKAEIAVFRPSNGTWYIGGIGPFPYGTLGDIPVVGDYNGDGKDDIAVFRPSNSTWYIRGMGPFPYGTLGDIPVVGDYNGDGKDDIAVFRPSNSTWYIGGIGSFPYGTLGDIPVVGDYNGDGKDDIAVFRPSNSTWYIGGIGSFPYGTLGDIPVVGDYNGDGKAEIAVFRPSNSTWYIGGIGSFPYGTLGDIPVVGDYNGDGKDDIAVFRPSNSTWYIRGIGTFPYGTLGDIPV